MKLLKNFEGAFVAVAAIVCTTAIVGTTLPAARSTDAPTLDAGTPMPVVVVSGKRMTPDEKLQSMREERQLALAREQEARRG
ncbi:MAG: hypothetical protein ACLGI6_19875 [Gammaproteobacteria bacterium]